MAHYTINHICGHSEEVCLYGRLKERSAKIEWLETIKCPDCRKKDEKAALNRFDEELGLPELSGTPRQVAWARAIRKSILEDLHKRFDELEGKKNKQGEIFDVINVFGAQDTARFWIDNRETNVSHEKMENLYRKLLLRKESEEERDARLEATVSPTIVPEGRAQSAGAVSIEIRSRLLLEYPKDGVFINIAKQNGFEWNPSSSLWTREIYSTASPEDQAGEIAHRFLEAGFSCCVLNDIAREKVISNTYIPTGTRILHATKQNFIFILLNRDDKDIDKIFSWLERIGGKHIPHCYNQIKVKSLMYRAVGDIAAEYNFAVDAQAKQLIEEQLRSEIIVSIGDNMPQEKIEQISRKIRANDPLSELIDDD